MRNWMEKGGKSDGTPGKQTRKSEGMSGLTNCVESGKS